MEGAIVHVEAAPLTRRAQLSHELLKEEMEQRTLLGQYVKKMMVEGTDYGKIPGSDKPTLLKPGAEKLIDLFSCTPEFTLVPEFCHEDFETGFFKYTFRCRIISRELGAVLAEGYGSANSRESRFRWRLAHRKCPACSKDTIIQGKSEYGGGWICFKKKGGCGEKYSTGDQQIEGQAQGRVENEDIADLDNTILKMAKKRALVDGAIALARCSDMFTQDVEDFAHGQDNRPPPGDGQPTTAGDDPSPDPLYQQTKRDSLKENAARLVSFGPHKGKPMRELAQLAVKETLTYGANQIANDPGMRWEPAVRTGMAALARHLSHEALGGMLDEELAKHGDAASSVFLSILEPEAERRSKEARPA